MQPQIETRIIRVNLKSLKLLEINARYMEPKEFQRLVDNIKRDQTLTSTPLVYRGEVISGNHRVQAAIKAGLEEADVMEIVSEITEDQKKAIQLSHNSINGKDDQNLLQQIYDSISDFEFKQYSALTDDDFKIQELDIKALGFEQPKMEEVTISFIAGDKQAFVDSLAKIEKRSKSGKLTLAADLSDFQTFYEAVITTKHKLNIINTAQAVKVMSEIALKALEDGGKKDTD